MWPSIVKVTRNKSRHVINIPVALARETGIDKTEYVIITKSGKKKLEIKRYDKEGDVTEYIQTG
jgi:RNase P protein component